MQFYLVKNFNFKNCSKVLKTNKSFRFNFLGQNFTFYKFNKLNFSNISNTSHNSKEKSPINSETKDKLENGTQMSKKDELESFDFDLESISDFKQITLNNYTSQIEKTDSPTNLPIKIEKIGNEEVEVFKSDKSLSKAENFEKYRKFLKRKEEHEMEYANHKMKMGIALFLFFVGLFSLWIPLYKTICETQGFAIKTTHTDYKFEGKKLNVMKKFTVKFIHEVDPELPWSFEPLQDKVVINAGETCLIFYRAKNLTDEPLIGLSVYDVHPQSLAMYFNKIQCFCFENQMLGPREEVDLPVFFYIDPSVNDEAELDEYREYVLKYSFYLAKKQDLAKVMSQHLQKEKDDRMKLNERKRELNKQGKNYKIEELDDKFTGLPGVNPLLQEFHMNENLEVNSNMRDNDNKN